MKEAQWWPETQVEVMGLGAAGCEVSQGCPVGWLLSRYLLTGCYKGYDRDQSFFKSLVSDRALFQCQLNWESSGMHLTL